MTRKRILMTLTVIGLLLLQHPNLFAEEEKKSLEELLIEKGVITKEDLKDVRQVKLAPWIDSISFFGDLRLRYEYFNYDNGNTAPPTNVAASNLAKNRSGLTGRTFDGMRPTGSV